MTQTKLTPKQEAFAAAYLETGNASEAYRRAYNAEGMADNVVHVKACELLKNGKVAVRVASARQQLADKLEITVERITKELAAIGFANMLDYIRTTRDGDAYVDLSALTREQAAAITEVIVEEYKEGGGESARDVKRTKFKLADKRSALVDLGKHLGMFPQNVNVSGQVKVTLSPEERSARIEELLSRAASRAVNGADSSH